MKTLLYRTLLSIIILLIFVSCYKNKNIVIEHSAMMFKNYQTIEMIKEIDYIGFSFHHEIYDVIIYHVVNGEINPNFCFDVLMNTGHIQNKSWKQCDCNNPAINYFPFFNTKKKYKKDVITSIYNGLSDSNNWYNWITTKDMNHLFLFCPNDNLLYYVKWNV